MQNRNDNNQPSIEARLAVWQRDTKFEGELPEKMADWMQKAFPYTSPWHLRVSVEDYRKMRVQPLADLSILDINSLGAVLKMRTQREMEMTHDEFLDFQDQVEKLSLHVMVVIRKKEAQLIADDRKDVKIDVSSKKNKNIPIPAKKGEA